MTSNLAEIEEVVEVGRHIANQLLAMGYRLLLVEQRALAGTLPVNRLQPDRGEVPYVRKDLVYCIGRVSGQDALEPLLDNLIEAERARRAAAGPRR